MMFVNNLIKNIYLLRRWNNKILATQCKMQTKKTNHNNRLSSRTFLMKSLMIPPYHSAEIPMNCRNIASTIHNLPFRAQTNQILI